MLAGKYELAAITAENPEWRSCEAREVPTGRAVLVHRILEPPQGQGVSLKELAGRCTPGSGGVLDRFASGGVDYIVTEASDVFRDLRAALERAAALPAPPPELSGEDRFTRVGAWRVPGSPAAPHPIVDPSGESATDIRCMPPAEPTAVHAAAPSEFTQMFRSPEPVAPPPLVELPEPVSQPAASEPGEFTRMFQTPAQPSQPIAPPAASQPGNFTSMFQAQAPAQPAPASPPPVSPEPGTFTRMFQAPSSASPSPPPSPQATSKPGEFTQFFQSSLGSAPYEESKPSATPYVASPPAAPPPGEYTRLFQMPAQQPSATPVGSGATNVFVTPPAPLPHSTIPIEQGPSEFTRMIQPPPPAGKTAADVPKMAAPAPAAAPGMPFMLIVLFTVLAVIAIGLVLFLVLRH